MKSFIASILLFCAITAAVIASGIHDTKATRLLAEQSEAILLSLTGEIDAPSEKLLSALRSTWDEKSSCLSYTVSTDHLNEIESALARLEGAFLANDGSLRILEARALCDATKSLYERVKPSIEGII